MNVHANTYKESDDNYAGQIIGTRANVYPHTSAVYVHDNATSSLLVLVLIQKAHSYTHKHSSYERLRVKIYCTIGTKKTARANSHDTHVLSQTAMHMDTSSFLDPNEWRFHDISIQFDDISIQFSCDFFAQIVPAQVRN